MCAVWQQPRAFPQESAKERSIKTATFAASFFSFLAILAHLAVQKIDFAILQGLFIGSSNRLPLISKTGVEPERGYSASFPGI